IGRLKTLAQKRAENPNVDLLVGAVNVWCWDGDAVGICRELQSAGVGRILWSHRRDPETLRALNEMGVLTSRYDIFQDVMDPANFPNLRGVHPDWTTPAWPKDLMLGADGDWVRGWRVKGKDDQWYPCGVLCDRQAVAYARERIPPELETHPYRCRFIDTTTASPWRECYDEDHPMTRSDSRRAKMDLLQFISRDCGLVTGSETGHEAAVPYVHYFEGMLSLGPYRVPDAGRNMREILEDVPEQVAKFQTGHYYRLPLWELVYHDCVVAQWYWGDYNNKLPAVWDRRDLLNALYGTPPMFMFDRRLWQEKRDRFVESYRTATEVARATGYAEMLSHAWLTDDHTVQQTRFAGGVTVTVNFGDRPHTLPDGRVLRPLSHRVEGLDVAR
ncbi:MAG TPA: glycoside hydrolase, partial [Thermoguttaceae bacterium]|nr:glycoside hydrolase [Thermoguttaceae bacterium]